MSFGQLERQRPADPMSQINITPLVDVMLVLLVLFILTAPLLGPAIRLDLPKGQAAPLSEGVRSVSLVLDASGTTYLDGRAVSPDELARSLARTAASQPDTEVQLRADTLAPYGQVMDLLGVAQKAGLQRVGFVTDAPALGATATSVKSDAAARRH